MFTLRSGISQLIYGIAFLLVPISVVAQSHRPGSAFDVLDYHFALELSDETDEIRGLAEISVRSIREGTLVLDLISERDRAQKGMRVSEVSVSGSEVKFQHQNDKLSVEQDQLSEAVSTGGRFRVTVRYSGIPVDGLIISKNKHGDRTFFGDNWPDRSRHWLPVMDHPGDKATVAWSVTAPSHYQVVANGRLVEETDLQNGDRLTRWRCDVPLPTKVMIMGAARFAVEHIAEVNGTLIQSWVYPQDRERGFRDLARTVNVLKLFEKLFGPYPFTKLAGVQSTTRYGGTENASAIFYAETTFDGTASNEPLIAHEVAHQWFGDSVTESDWEHVWLSEGFATYLANVYIEKTYGREEMNKRLERERKRVFLFDEQAPLLSIIDTRAAHPTDLLNANSYQKGGWVLHMLRNRVGDDAFFAGLRSFYETYRGKNASTTDFRRIMEAVSEENLEGFFAQWLDRPEEPRIQGTWKFDSGAKAVTLTLTQTQNGAAFDLPIEVGLSIENDASNVQRIQMATKSQSFKLPAETKPAEVTLDPRTNLLVRFQLDEEQ